MPATEEIVELVVDGYALTGWQSVEITRSMQDAAITFRLTATNPAWSAEAKALRLGKLVEIRTSAASGLYRPGGGDLLCKGYVDDYDADYEADSKVIRVSGRSKAADAIDCPPSKHKTGRIEKKNLKQVATELDEFGIGFDTDEELDPIDKVQIQPGETLFATLDREASRLGYMLSGQPDGSVKITRAGSKRHGGAIRLGDSPVEHLSVQIGCAHKHSPIVVRGQRSHGVGKDSLRQEVEELDASVDRHRPIVIILDGDAAEKDLKTKAKWQKLRNAGFGTRVSARVSTWRDEGGLLWDPGRLIATVVDEQDLDQDLTLSTVRFAQSIDKGTIASLELVDPRSHGGKKGDGKSDEAFDAGPGLDD